MFFTLLTHNFLVISSRTLIFLKTPPWFQILNSVHDVAKVLLLFSGSEQAPFERTHFTASSYSVMPNIH